MNCLIIDDNSKTLEALSALLKASGSFANVHNAVQPYMVRSLMSWEQIDVIFIRVRLWHCNVFEKIAEDKMPVVVFLSGGKERITEKESNTVEYSLREPYDSEGIKKLMSQIVFKPVNERPDFFFVHFEGRHHKIHFKDFELVELVKGKSIKLHTVVGSFILPGPISVMMDRLPEDLFIRISDGLIIPASEFPKVSGNEYEWKGKLFKLTRRFAAAERREMEIWPHGL
ncbi:MAG: hypothetical protein V4539_10050 [Bacteroidota bacterium]